MQTRPNAQPDAASERVVIVEKESTHFSESFHYPIPEKENQRIRLLIESIDGFLGQLARPPQVKIELSWYNNAPGADSHLGLIEVGVLTEFTDCFRI